MSLEEELISECALIEQAMISIDTWDIPASSALISASILCVSHIQPAKRLRRLLPSSKVALSPGPSETTHTLDPQEGLELGKRQITWPTSAKLLVCIVLLGISVHAWEDKYCQPLDDQHLEKGSLQLPMQETAQVVLYVSHYSSTH